MRLVYGHLCDYAATIDGGKPLIAGAFDLMRGPPSGPIPFPAASLAYGLAVNGFEARAGQFMLRLVNEDGVESLRYIVDVTFETEVPGAEAKAHGAVFLPRNLQFERPGTYVFEFSAPTAVSVEQGVWEIIGEIPFHVVRASPAPNVQA